MSVNEMINAVQDHDGYIEISVSCSGLFTGMIVSEEKSIFLHDAVIDIDDGKDSLRIEDINKYDIYFNESELGDEFDLINGNTRITMLLIA